MRKLTPETRIGPSRQNAEDTRSMYELRPCQTCRRLAAHDLEEIPMNTARALTQGGVAWSHGLPPETYNDEPTGRIKCRRDDCRRTIDQHTIAQVRSIYERASKDMGEDLQGFSVVDLILDNLSDEDGYLTSDEAREAATLAGVYDRWKRAWDAEREREQREEDEPRASSRCEGCDHPEGSIRFYRVTFEGRDEPETCSYCDGCAEHAVQSAAAHQQGTSFPSMSDTVAIEALPMLYIEDVGANGVLLQHPAWGGCFITVVEGEVIVGHDMDDFPPVTITPHIAGGALIGFSGPTVRR